MTHFHRTVLALVGVFASALLTIASAEAPKRPIPLIFDTDIGNDVDDVLAMGVIHSLQSRGECELLAVTITKDHAMAAPFADAVNTFYGRGDIPIGMCDSGVTDNEGKFNSLAAVKDGSEFRFPHDLLSGDDAPDAVKVLRKALADAEDGTVVIAQVGFSTNLANLLKSEPDAISKLGGKELIQQKVRLLSMMAGAFSQIVGDTGHLYDHHEYNIVKDIPSAIIIAKQWPTPIIWSGFEIGIAVPYPHQSIEQDYKYVPHHPLPEAYIAYQPPPHNRPTWDLTSVLYAIRPERGYFGLSSRGTVAVADDGLTTFATDQNGSHQYLTLTDEQKIQVTETLVGLSSEPAKR